MTNDKPKTNSYCDYWRKQGSPARDQLQAAAAGADGPLQDTEFRLLADNLPTLCWFARADGYIVWYNRRWHDYCGTTPGDMEGWGWKSVHDPEALPRVIERWSRSIATGEPFEMTFPLRGGDGQFRPFLTRIVPLRGADGEIFRWYGVNTEISAEVAAVAGRKESEAKYSVLTDAMPQMVWSTLPDGFHDYYNAQWYAFTGVPEGSTDGEAWNGMFHPDDQEKAWSAWRHSLATGEPYEIEYRLRHHSGAYRWTLGRALPVRNEDGEIIRWIGTCTDIDGAKRVAEQSNLLSHELSHRIKNIFAVISSLIRLSAKRSNVDRDFANELQGRISALGRAHEFARPHSEDSKPVKGMTTFHALLAELFSAYEDRGRARIEIRGLDCPIDDRGATPIALIFHELATNATKYGALSSADGRVEITVSGRDELEVRWSERGGPVLQGPPAKEGFGTQLSTISVERQLGGTIARAWKPDGLEVTIKIPAGRLLRGEVG